jgi:DNA repair exonuclease SbcCD ATPase subunit
MFQRINQSMTNTLAHLNEISEILKETQKERQQVQRLIEHMKRKDQELKLKDQQLIEKAQHCKTLESKIEKLDRDLERKDQQLVESQSKIKELEKELKKKDQQLKESTDQCTILESNIEKVNIESKIQGKINDVKEKLITRCKDCKNYEERVERLELDLAKESSNLAYFKQNSSGGRYREEDYRDLKLEFCKFREKTEQFNWEREEKVDMMLKDIQQHREAEKNYTSKLQSAEDQISKLKERLEEKGQAINSSDSGWVLFFKKCLRDWSGHFRKNTD